MLLPYSREAIFLLEEGALPNEVDQVLEDFGLAMGLCRMGDLAGESRPGWCFTKLVISDE